MSTYKVSFSELKEKVGINDVAFSLGYQLNRKAGVGKYYELVLGPVNNPIDTIIIRKTESKSQQTFFRRNGSKGDVIALIKENLNSFNVEGKNDWIKVANVLRQFANMPPVVLTPDRKAVEQAKTSTQVFNADRYELSSIHSERVNWLLAKRGFSKDTVTAMGDSITLIKDKNQKNFDGFNIGFPYRHADSNEITGYEIRGGNGFKSKAAGTDSANSLWYAEFGGSGHGVRNVYLFESSFDAMAFYQMNKTKITMSPFALVSMGGSFTQNQVEGVMKRFPAAKLWDCFDNDLAGNVYSKNLVVYSEKQPLDIQYKNDENGNKLAVLTKGNESVTRYAESFCFQEAAKELGIKYSMGHWKAPSNFKDWNDCLLGIKINYVPSVTKNDRNQNLAERRNKQNSISL